MSIWQNFKETDHAFEKRFIGAILLMALAIASFFLIEEIFGLMPDVRKLFVDNSTYFIGFLIAAIVTCLTTFLFYVKTLDFFEAETSGTKKAVIFSVIVWITFWVSWSIYCACLTLNFQPQTFSVKVTIWILVLGPGLLAFFISRNIRRQDIFQENNIKSAKNNNSYSVPNTIFMEKKYYSGYYSLLCVPVYLIALLIAHFI